ncbi:[NiFe]-hydrogenase assembly chaperone HybE [Azospirillum sp. HJ39]
MPLGVPMQCPDRGGPAGGAPPAGLPDGFSSRLDALLAAYRMAGRGVGRAARRGAAGNPALAVEAVGFHPCGPGRLGCMVTPWFLEAVLLPDDPFLWAEARDGDPLPLELPSGRHRFTAARMGLLGTLAAIPLASDMALFLDAEDARHAARLALDTLSGRPAQAPSGCPVLAGPWP